jgi:hypothetical protein
LEAAEPRIFYRIVKSSSPTERDFIPQKAEGKAPPEDSDTEAQFSWEHGVSVMNTKVQAIKKARGLRGVLGRYVVGVRVEEDGPVRYLKTGGSGHFDLIGEPADIFARVVLPAEDVFTD